MANTALLWEVYTVICLVALTALCSVAAPTDVLMSAEMPRMEGSTSLAVRLLSEESGRFVAAAKGGWVHAHSNRGGKAARFYPSYLESGFVRLESVKYPGKYVVIKNGRLRIDVPVDDNDVFEFEYSQRPGLIALRLAKNKDCYIAFDEDGSHINTCELSSKHQGRWLTYVIT